MERQGGDELHVLFQVPTIRDSVAFEELEVSGEKIGTEPDRRERAKQTLVIVIGHPTAVLYLRSSLLNFFISLDHLAEHVLDGLPGDPPLGVEVVEVVHHELVARCEVCPIELVRDVPAQRTKLSSFLNSCMQKCNCVQHWSPIR